MAIPLEQESTLETTAPMHNFNIEVNSSMFSLLTKNIYTDNVLAVMREWSTNAIDACIAANLPIKFKVNLPSVLSPEFSVRDYGTGLDEDSIAGLFSTLGASTKRGSNAYNGQFGIGRMAGLAYTDSFTVTSYINGSKLVYLITKKDGIPNMVSLGATATNEPNGLKLSIAVAKRDTHDFIKKAKELYEFFDNKPILEPPFEPIDATNALEDDTWVWNTKYTTFGHTYQSIRVIMGNVAYKVEWQSEFDEEQPLFRLDGFCLKMPLGSVSITPGRESLNFDDKTKAALKAQLKKAYTELPKAILAEVQRQPDDWSKIVVYHEFYNKVGPNFIRLSLRSMKLPFAKHYTDGGALLLPELPGIDIRVFSNGSLKGRTTEDAPTVIPLRGTNFIIGDTRIYHKEALTALRSTSNVGTTVLFKMGKWSKDPQAIADFTTAVTNYCKELGKVPLYKTSELLPEEDVTVTKNTLRGPVSILEFRLPSTQDTNFEPFRGSPIAAKTLDGTYYYIKMNAFVCDDPSLTDEKISAYLRGAALHNKQFKDDPIHIIGIPKSGMKLIQGIPNFVPLSGAIDAKLAKIQLVDYTTSDMFLVKSSTISTVAKKYLGKDIPEEVKEYIKAALQFVEKYPSGSAQVCEKNLHKEFGSPINRITSKLQTPDIILKYPLLHHLFTTTYSWSSQVNEEQIVDYLNNQYKGK